MNNSLGFSNIMRNIKNEGQSNAATSNLTIVRKDRQTNEESNTECSLPSNKKKIKVKLTKSPTDTSSLLFATTTKLNNNVTNIAKITTKDGDKISMVIINNLIIRDIKTQEIVVDTNENCLDSNVTLTQITKYNLSQEYVLEAVPSLILNINQKEIHTFELSEFYNIPYTKKEIKAFIKKIMNRINNSQDNIKKYA